MNAGGREGSVQRDHLKFTAHLGGLTLTRAPEGGLRKIADHPEHKSTELLIHSQLRQREMEVLTGFQLKGQGLHPVRSRNRARLRHATELPGGTFLLRQQHAIVSFLKGLLEELQEQLQSETTSITVAQVAEAADSERLNVTLAVGVMGRLKQHALAEGRSCSSLANFLIEDGLRRHGTLR